MEWNFPKVEYPKRGYETRPKENYYSKFKKSNVSLARMESSKYGQDFFYSINSYLSYIKRDGPAYSHSIKMLFRNRIIKLTYPCICVAPKHPGKVECAGYKLTCSLCHTMFLEVAFFASCNLGLCGKGLKGTLHGMVQYEKGKCKEFVSNWP